MWELEGVPSLPEDGKGWGKKSQQQPKKSMLEKHVDGFSKILASPAANNPSQRAIRITLSLPEEHIFCPAPSKPSRNSFL